MTIAVVPRNYAVTWREPGDRARSGKLTLGPSSLRLECGGPYGSLARTLLRNADIATVEAACGPGERILGRPTVVLRRRQRPPLFIAGLNGAGFVGELVDHVQTAISRRDA